MNAPALAIVPNAYSLDAIINEAKALATNEVTGANAKIDFVFSMAVAAQSGMIKEADAKDIFSAYLTAKMERAADKATIAGKAKASQKIGENYAAKTTSEWRQAIKCGSLANVDGVASLNHARAVAGELSIHVYDSLITIARKQIGKHEEQFDKDRVMTELQPSEDKPEHTEMKALKAIIKSIEKMVNGAEESETSNARPAFPSEMANQAKALLEERLAAITPAADATVSFLKAQGYSDAIIKAMMSKV